MLFSYEGSRGERSSEETFMGVREEEGRGSLKDREDSGGDAFWGNTRTHPEHDS